MDLLTDVQFLPIMRGLKEFKVRLEKSEFSAGELLKGGVCVIIGEPIVAKCINVSIYGKGTVCVTQADNKSYSQEFFTFRDTIAVFDKKQVGAALFTPGNHTFFFKYQLPKNIPASFVAPCEEGGISYCVECFMKYPKKIGTKCVQTIAEFVLNDHKVVKLPPKDTSKFGLEDCTYLFTPFSRPELCDAYSANFDSENDRQNLCKRQKELSKSDACLMRAENGRAPGALEKLKLFASKDSLGLNEGDLVSLSSRSSSNISSDRASSPEYYQLPVQMERTRRESGKSQHSHDSGFVQDLPGDCPENSNSETRKADDKQINRPVGPYKTVIQVS